MKKILPIVVLLLLLGVGGYFYMNSKGISPKKTGVMTGSSAGENVFTSIKDALSKSLSLKCVYKNEAGVESTSYIKAGAVRMVTSGSTDNDQPGNILIKDKKMYMWSDVTKKGFTYSIEEPKDVSPYPTSADNPDANTGDKQESVLAQIEKYKDACKAEVIDDSFFVVPTDVEFQDMSALQKQFMEGLPKTTPQSGDNDSANYEDYIKQIQQQQSGGEE